MSVTLGVVVGDTCPHCKVELNLEGEFFEGTEVECDCGTLLCVGDIEATYTVTMNVVAQPHTKRTKP